MALEEPNKMKEVEVYTTNWCPYCVAAKRLLAEQDIEYEEINVESDDEKRQWLLQVTGQRTVPQIFIKGEPIGGFTELNGLAQSGALAELIGGDNA